MALGHSPRTVTNGLVFAFDANNFKSYKGPAIQNMATAIVAATQSGTGYSFTAGSESVNIPGVGATTAQTITGYNNYSAVSAVCCPQLFYYTVGNGSVACSPSTTYTYGLVYKTQSGYTHPNFMYRYEYSASDVYVTEGGVHSTTNRIHLGDGWYWAWGTFTTGATTTKLYLRYFYYNYSTTNDKMFVAKVLVTPGTYTGMHPKYWPNVGETKDASNTIYNITNTNTISYANLTYDTAGSISFNGTSNYIVGSDLGDLARFTCEAWVNITAFPSAAYPCYLSNVYPGTTAKVNFALGHLGASSGILVGFYDGAWHYSPAYTPSLNTWYHVVGTYDGAVLSLYVNGVSQGTPTSYVGTPSSSTGGMRIGRRWDAADYFTGNIAVAKVYNRALTLQEVTQNFNSLRGRFGV
jgi:hypothetical protein